MKQHKPFFKESQEKKDLTLSEGLNSEPIPEVSREPFIAVTDGFLFHANGTLPGDTFNGFVTIDIHTGRVIKASPEIKNPKMWALAITIHDCIANPKNPRLRRVLAALEKVLV